MNIMAAAVVSAAWVTVTPQTLSVQVPESLPVERPGAVQPKEWRDARPAVVCEILEAGRVVGFSFSGCNEVNHGRLP